MISKILEFENSLSATRHWLLQRITAVILILLTYHLVVFLQLCMKAPYQETVAWLKAPINTASIIVWLVVVFYHAAMGLQVVLEDYLANQVLRDTCIKGIKLGFLFLAIIALFFLIRIP